MPFISLRDKTVFSYGKEHQKWVFQAILKKFRTFPQELGDSLNSQTICGGVGMSRDAKFSVLLIMTFGAASGHNPVKMVRDINRDKMETAAKDPTFLELFDSVIAKFDNYMTGKKGWCAKNVTPRFQGGNSLFFRRICHSQFIANLRGRFRRAGRRHLQAILRHGRCRWLPSDSCIPKATSTNTLPLTAGKKKSTRNLTSAKPQYRHALGLTDVDRTFLFP